MLPFLSILTLMAKDDSIQQIKGLCPNISTKLLEDFIQGMDSDYFSSFSWPTIAQHVTLVHRLTLAQPCATEVQDLPNHQYRVTIVAYDYFSEFATFCGVLSSFGLDIREALIFTSSQQPVSSSSGIGAPRHAPFASQGLPARRPQPGLSRNIGVDVFTLQVLEGFEFGPLEQQRFSETLVPLVLLLQQNHVRQARRQINRTLVETLGRFQLPETRVVQPVQITFSNTLAEQETVLDIRSTDTPAFLYAFANALAMRGVYLVKAKIEVDRHRVRNRLFVRGRQGRKIQDKHEQQELRTAAALIKEFTHSLRWAPDPGKALEHFDQFLDQLMEQPQTSSALSILGKTTTLEHLAQLFGSSDYLWEDLLRRQHQNLLPMMNQYQKGPLIRSKGALQRGLDTLLKKGKTPETRKMLLNQFKDEELFRIDMRHLLNNSPLPDFSKALTHLADVILSQALLESRRVIDPKSPKTGAIPMAIFGLGKLGGTELGYASDIEILFVYDLPKVPRKGTTSFPTDYFERWAQEFLKWIEAKQEGIFHLDTRLRPHGDKGLLANSLQEIQRYYCAQGSAAPFERQALIKLRYVGGNRSIGQAVERHRDTFVYGPEPWDLATALHLRARQMKELVPSGSIHVKYSPGGLIDIEYTVQYLQLMHGHTLPAIQTPNTLQALQGLCQASFISQRERDVLSEHYVFLRQLIDALRIVRGNAHDLVLPPSGSEEMVFLARRLGFVATDWQQGAADLEQTITTHMQETHERFLHRFEKHKRLDQ
ncbi:MAG: hypothetical protein H6749_12405 [Nitrospiraceae bacterium]|nr:hypothetical protein [Nitrospiraceae bacterium]